MSKETPYSKKSDDDLLSEIHEYRDDGEGYWSRIYDQGRADKEFVTIRGGQWDNDVYNSRKAAKIPTLEINLLRTYCRQQVNIARQSRPSALIKPIDNADDPKIAKIWQGLVKDFELSCGAENALDTAVENAIYSGIGFYRLATDYVDAQSFSQEPKYLPIHNPEAVLIDPLSKELDGSDMSWAIVAEWVNKDVLEAQYGEDIGEGFDSLNNPNQWVNTSDDTICVAECFWIEEVKEKLCLLEDGSTVWKKDLIDGQIVTRERDSMRRTVQWAKVTGSKVLERGEFPSEYIPIFPIYGEVTWIENDRHVFGLVHFAKDPQRLFNYWKSTEALQLSEMVDAPWLASYESIANHEDIWKNPKGHRVLPYNATMDGTGAAIPPPQRIGFPGSPTGVLNAAMGAQQNITDILNMHAPVMGAQGNETSGVAIRQRQMQSETAQFHFDDNRNKTYRHSTRVAIQVMQKIYDIPMVKRIIGVDGQAELVKLDPNGQGEGIFNPSIGRFDVAIDTSPAYQTMREQTFSQLTELIQAQPDLIKVFGDLMMKNSPFLDSAEMAQRLSALIDPAVKSTMQEGGQNPEVQAVMAQAEQQMQQLQAQLEQAMAVANDKEAERKLKYQTELLKAQTSLQIAEMNNSSKADIEELKGAIALIQQQMIPPPEWMQMNQTNPPSAGFSLPEIQDFNALDASQIENNAPPMTADLTALPQSNGMPE